jgi:hypothetical protein
MLARKKRTREHILADLGINHVERQILLDGHVPERVVYDYGYDLLLFSFDSHGHPEIDQIYFQVKATARIANNDAPTLRIERSHLVHWLAERLPVILVLYDASNDVGYWVHIQHHFHRQPGFNLFTTGRTVTVRLDRESVFNQDAVKSIVATKNKVLKTRLSLG